VSRVASGRAAGVDLEPFSGARAGIYAGLVCVIVALDALTKGLAQRTLPPYQPVPIAGDVLRLTYIYNPGAAFGMHLGEYSRYLFLSLTVVVLVVLFFWYRSTPASDRLRLVAIATVSGGAVGNLIDRIRSSRGVVDFLDIGLGTMRWPVFNVADIAVTTGAFLLAISLWREEREAGRGRI
jgi:signal peptidase II